jgi:hypothetical protein
MPARPDVTELVGQQFGQLTLLGPAPMDSGRRTCAEFSCACGSKTIKVLTKVVQGKTKSCGCFRGNKARGSEEMAGKRFGRLEIVERAFIRNQKSFWKCRCDCGEAKVVALSNLRNGSTRSCGCLSLENSRAVGRLGKGVRAHNWAGVGDMSASFWGQVLAGAASRNLEVGITAEQAWALFVDQDRRCALTGWPLHFPPCGERSGTASLDRVDSSKGYVEGNLQWVHKRIQRMKWRYSQENFIAACKAVAEASS